jgi:hypothetical protein
MIRSESETWRSPMRLLFAGALCAVFAAAGSASAAPAGKLAPADIQSTFFDGKPFTSSTPQNIKYTMVFTADGKMTRDPVGKSGVKGEGTWKLSKDGFCTTWKNSAANCFSLVSAGDNKWSVLKGTSVIGTWSK